jgi:hypothetical protein
LFFEKGFGTAVAPVDHADYVVTGVFGQAFLKRLAGKQFFGKACGENY